MINNNNSALYSALFVLITLAGCSGGGGGGDDSPTVSTGVFIDSPVANIGYRTNTQEGVTDSLGQFSYLPGETVTFFIGALEFPPVPASATVTPLDIADTDDPMDDTVVNIVRLIQTLDQDGNPDNGIMIPAAATTVATQVDFNLTPANFAASTAVLNLITNAGQDTTVTQLVSVEDAVAHFEQQLTGVGVLVGTYLAVGQSTDLIQSNAESFIWTYAITFDREGGCSYVGSLEQGVFINGGTGLPEIFDGTPDNGTCTYSLASDGMLTFDGTGSYAVSPDTNTIIGVDATSETGFSGTYIESMVKQGSGLSNASLNGTYLAVGKSNDLVATNTESFIWTYTLTFDGAGNCSYTGTSEQGAILNGTTGQPEIFVGTPDSGVCTYNLASNGMLSFDGGDVSYIVSPDTSSIYGVGAGGGTDTAGTYIESMVKQSNSLSDASLNGTYLAVGKSTDLTVTNTESFIWMGSVTFDGTGGCNYTGSMEQGAILNGTTGQPEIFVGTPDGGTCTYSLASDGTISVDGEPLYAVSPDLNTIVGVNAGEDTGYAGTYIEFLVKSVQ